MKIQTAADPSVKNTLTPKTPLTQAGLSKGQQTSPAPPRAMTSPIAAAGLPSDKLSASIVSFARFFSLPLKPELLAAIRRQALQTPQKTTQQTAAAQPSMAAQTGGAEGSLRSAAAVPDSHETVQKLTGAAKFPVENAAESQTAAKALAAAAAQSKGVELDVKGLETYTEAINPDGRRQEDSRQQERRDKNRNGHESENLSQKTTSVIADPYGKTYLKETLLQYAEKDPLLAILNRLPGKNGRRWIVLPFNFSENGKEFKVSLRILPETEQAFNPSDRMALDIVESGQSGVTERRWLFMFEQMNRQSNAGAMATGLAGSRLTVRLQPELPPKTVPLFINELSQVLGIPHERITIKAKTGSFPFEADDYPLRAIDEVV